MVVQPLNDLLEHAFHLSHESQSILRKIAKASKTGALPKAKPHTLVEQALEKNIISKKEVETLQLAKDVCNEAIEVDDFKLEDYKKGVANLLSEDDDHRDGGSPLASNA